MCVCVCMGGGGVLAQSAFLPSATYFPKISREMPVHKIKFQVWAKPRNQWDIDQF